MHEKETNPLSEYDVIYEAEQIAQQAFEKISPDLLAPKSLAKRFSQRMFLSLSVLLITGSSLIGGTILGIKPPKYEKSKPISKNEIISPQGYGVKLRDITFIQQEGRRIP